MLGALEIFIKVLERNGFKVWKNNRGYWFIMDGDDFRCPGGDLQTLIDDLIKELGVN